MIIFFPKRTLLANGHRAKTQLLPRIAGLLQLCLLLGAQVRQQGQLIEVLPWEASLARKVQGDRLIRTKMHRHRLTVGASQRQHRAAVGGFWKPFQLIIAQTAVDSTVAGLSGRETDGQAQSGE